MKQVIVRKGAIVVEEVPAPVVEPGTVLVRVERSCISVGTELSGIRASGDAPVAEGAAKPAEGQARRRCGHQPGPDRRTRPGQLESLAAGAATGYSAAGNGHRESGRESRDSASVTALPVREPSRPTMPRSSGCRATSPSRVPDERLDRGRKYRDPGGDRTPGRPSRRTRHWVRRSSSSVLGCWVRSTAQLLRANGCHVIGTDLDASRVALARELGMDVATIGRRRATSAGWQA